MRLHAELIGLGSPLDVPPGIRGAVELTFQTETGKYYQIEISENLTDWDAEGYSVKGTGGEVRVLVSTRNLTRAFYRLRDDGDPDNTAPVGPEGPVGPTGSDGASIPAGADSKLFWLMKHLIDDRQSTKAPVIRTLTLGDSWKQDCVSQMHGTFGVLGTVRGPDWCTLSGGAAASAFYSDYDKSPWGRSITMSAAGSAIFNNSPGTGRMPVARYLAVMYEGQPANMGGFTVQYENSAGGWQTVANVATNAVATSGFQVWESPVLGNAISTRIKVSWMSGSVRIYAAGVTNYSGNVPEAGLLRQGLIDCDVSSSGSDIAVVASIPQSAWSGLLAWLKPDVVFCREKGNGAAAQWGWHWQSMIDKIRAARPQCDIVMIGRHLTNDGSEPFNEECDEWMRDWCETHNGLFVNIRAYMPSTFEEARALGINRQVDNIHLANYGDLMVQNIIWDHFDGLKRWATDTNGNFQGGPRWAGAYQQGGAGVVFDGSTGGKGKFSIFDSGLGNTGNYSERLSFIVNGTSSASNSNGFSISSDSQVIVDVDTSGRWFFGGPGTNMASRSPSARIEAFAWNPTHTPICASGVSGQTADLLELRTGVAQTGNNRGSVASAFDRLGNLRFEATGIGVQIKAVTNGRIGTAATLVNGSVTVANTSVTTNTQVLLTCTALGGLPGVRIVVTKTPGTSFKINAYNSAGTIETADNSVFDWQLTERVP